MPKRRRDPHHPHPDGIRLVSSCPMCRTNYDPRQARVLNEKDDSRLLWVECAQCGNAILALVLVSSAGVSSVGLVTDLTYEDAARFRASEPVSADHVLAARTLLADGTAFFSRLL